MPTATITCTECGPLSTVTADDYRELVFRLQSEMVSAHATKPHHKHPLRFELDDAGKQSSPHTIVFDCLACDGHAEYEAPIEMVGAYAILFHTSHEGHRFRMTYRGKSDESPEK